MVFFNRYLNSLCIVLLFHSIADAFSTERVLSALFQLKSVCGVVSKSLSARPESYFLLSPYGTEHVGVCKSNE